MQCCIILTVNLLTWRKVSPVFYWNTEPFIPAHDNEKISLPSHTSLKLSFLSSCLSLRWLFLKLPISGFSFSLSWIIVVRLLVNMPVSERLAYGQSQQIWTALLTYLLLRLNAWLSGWKRLFRRFFTLVKSVLWNQKRLSTLIACIEKEEQETSPPIRLSAVQMQFDFGDIWTARQKSDKTAFSKRMPFTQEYSSQYHIFEFLWDSSTSFVFFEFSRHGHAALQERGAGRN